MEAVEVIPRLLTGETVTFTGRHFRLERAALHLHPERRVPLLVGGSNRRLLRLAAEEADIVELGGTGRTLPDGHSHETRWSEGDTDRLVGTVQSAAEAAGRQPVLSALVQSVVVTDDAEAAVAKTLKAASRVMPPEALPSVQDMLQAPYVLVGTLDEIASKIRRLQQRWGFSRYTVRDLSATAAVIAFLSGGRRH